MKTFSEYQNARILDKNGKIANGDYLENIEGEEEVILRIKNGFLNDGTDEEGRALPAIQFTDGSHIEHWRNGVLHADNIPAVVDNMDGREEWWLHGRKFDNPTINRIK